MTSLIKPVEVLEEELEQQFIATEYLVKLYEKFGLSESITHHDFITNNTHSPQWKFLDALVTMWKALYPSEYKTWIKELKDELTIERSVREHVKGGGYQPVAYPVRFYEMCKLFFPKLKIQEKEFVRRFVRLFPEFKATNYRI